MKLSLNSFWLGIFTILFFASSWKVEASSSYAPKVEIDSSGNAVAVWETNERTHRVIQAAVYTSGSGWSSSVDISESEVDSFAPAIAMNSSGDAVVIWTAVNTANQDLNLYAKELPSGGSWSSIINVSTANIDLLDSRVGANEPHYKISINGDGDIVIVWTTNGNADHVIHSVTATFGSTWNAPVQLSP